MLKARGTAPDEIDATRQPFDRRAHPRLRRGLALGVLRCLSLAAGGPVRGRSAALRSTRVLLSARSELRRPERHRSAGACAGDGGPFVQHPCAGGTGRRSPTRCARGAQARSCGLRPRSRCRLGTGAEQDDPHGGQARKAGLEVAEETGPAAVAVFCGLLSATLARHGLAQAESFAKFGLTDTAIVKLVKDQFLVLTDDFPLSNYLGKQGVDVLNFNHLRFASWR